MATNWLVLVGGLGHIRAALYSLIRTWYELVKATQACARARPGGGCLWQQIGNKGKCHSLVLLGIGKDFSFFLLT